MSLVVSSIMGHLIAYANGLPILRCAKVRSAAALGTVGFVIYGDRLTFHSSLLFSHIPISEHNLSLQSNPRGYFINATASVDARRNTEA